MFLELHRTYYMSGTNGQLFINGELQCYTIELPWLWNRPQQSCIPEGTYQLYKRYSKKHGHHLWVMNVIGRSYILIHPANDALLELKGCIASVTKLTASGRGAGSRAAFNKLLDILYPLLKTETIYLTIKKQTT